MWACSRINLVLKLKCWFQICTKMAWITTLFAKRLQLLGDIGPQTHTIFYISANKTISRPQILNMDFSSMSAIEHDLEPICMMYCNDNFLSQIIYVPKWMVSSLIFQKISGRGSPSPHPRPLPRFFSGFAHGSGFTLQISGASRSRLDSRALRAESGFALNFRLENMVWPLQNKFLGPPLHTKLL